MMADYRWAGAGAMKEYGFRLSVPEWAHSSATSAAQQVCCCGPGRREISIDCCSCGRRMRAVPHCQHTLVAEHRLFADGLLMFLAGCCEVSAICLQSLRPGTISWKGRWVFCQKHCVMFFCCKCSFPVFMHILTHYAQHTVRRGKPSYIFWGKFCATVMTHYHIIGAYALWLCVR